MKNYNITVISVSALFIFFCGFKQSSLNYTQYIIKNSYTVRNFLLFAKIYVYNNNLVFTKNTNLKMYHLNIRISKNFDELKILLKQLCCSFDCIVLTETFNIAKTTFFYIEGYTTIHNNGKINKNDGVVIYIKENIDFVWQKH